MSRKEDKLGGFRVARQLQLALHHSTSYRAGRDGGVCFTQEAKSGFDASCLSSHQHRDNVVAFSKISSQRNGRLYVRSQLDDSHWNVFLLFSHLLQGAQAASEDSQAIHHDYTAGSAGADFRSCRGGTHKVQRNQTLLCFNRQHAHSHRILREVLYRHLYESK